MTQKARNSISSLQKLKIIFPALKESEQPSARAPQPPTYQNLLNVKTFNH